MKIKNEDGVTLVTVIIMIVVMSIIASVSIVGGVKVLREAKAQVRESNLADVKAVVNREAAKVATAGVFTPANYNHYGTPAFGIVSGDADILNGWYLVDEDDLKEMGVDYIGENYLVNYKANKVVALNDYLLSGNLDDENTQESEKSNSVVTLAKNGTLKVGDYIDYKPSAVATYTTNPNNTGNAAQTFTADTGANWRILSVNQSTGEVIITTEEAVNNNFALSGIKAYMNGKTELNNVCKSLYSNNDMGLVARSMTVEDVNKACGMNNPSELETEYDGRYGNAYYNLGYAYYPIDNDGGVVYYNGKEYIRMFQQSETSRFYTYDGGGIEATDENGFKYRYSTEDNPVYVSRTSYKYNIHDYNVRVADVLGNNCGWLASTCVSPKYIMFMTKFDKIYLCYSNTTKNSLILLKNKIDVAARQIPYYSLTHDIFVVMNGTLTNLQLSYADNASCIYNDYGIRPVVVLGASSRIDVDDTSRDGSSAEKAWSLIK